MSQLDLATLDWVILVGYLVIIAGVGLVASLGVKGTHDYFIGGRRFNKWLMIGQSFGTGTHADMPVSVAGAVYGVGVSAIWYQWKNLFATPFYWLFAPLFHRIRRTTVAEMVEDRYGPWMGRVYTVFALCFFTINSAGMLKGAAKVIGQVVGGAVPVNEIVLAMTVVFIFYSFIGGLVAAAWTDFLQGFLILVLSFLLIPLGWGTVGGMSGMKQTLAAWHFSLAAPQGIGPWFVAALTVNGLIGILAQPHLMASVGSGKDERSCRIGFMYGNLVKRFCTLGWAVVGLIAATMIAGGRFGLTKLGDPEDAFGFACRHLLFPGGAGLLIACILAANMAGCSAFMVDSGALFTNGLYRPIQPHHSDQHYLWVGRVSGLLVTIGSVLYAVFLIKRVLYSFLLTETAATYVGISILAGMFWRRANRWGAIASIVAAVTVNFSLYRWRGERLDHWDPAVFSLSVLAGIVALILVSLLTPREPHSGVESFYNRLETPVDARDTGQQLILVNLFQLRQGAKGSGLIKAYRTDLEGFGIGWLIVLSLIGLAWLIFNL